MDAPSSTQTLIHWLPLPLLLASLGLLHSRTLSHAAKRRGLSWLAGVFPAGLGLITALREHAGAPDEMPGFGVLLCVASLWWFVGAASACAAGTSTDIGATPAFRHFATPPSRERLGLVVVAVCASLITLTIAPRYLETNLRQAAWEPSGTAGALMTVAGAGAIALGIVLHLIGPNANATQPPPRRVRTGQLLQALLLACVGALSYWLMTR